MRVIAGDYKGRRLVCPKSDKIRPTTDKVKEALFGALQFFLPGAYVLDAFAGSGALGIESLSRGAAHVDFVEKDPECQKALKRNAETITKTGYEIYKGDIFRLMSRLKKYDIVFLDPPYDAELYIKFLKLSDTAGILGRGCKVAIECRKKFDFILPEKYNFIKKKDYGDISLWYLEYGG
jgi:16S rRNA (guanine966-N2)-methyltransferase